MAESNTTRFGLRRWTAGSDTPSRDEFDTAHLNIETLVAGFTKGLASARPAAGAAFDRWLYWSTDTSVLEWCDATAWRRIALLASGITTDYNGEEVREAQLAAYTEKIVTNAASGSTEALDCAVANVFDLTLDQACTISVTNVEPSSAKATTITIVLRNGASAFAATWPSSFKWAGGTAPTLSGVNKADIISATTLDGGTTWAATLVQDFASLGS